MRLRVPGLLVLGFLVFGELDRVSVWAQLTLGGHSWEVAGGGFYNASLFDTQVTSTGRGLTRATVMDTSGQADATRILRWRFGSASEELRGYDQSNSAAQAYQNDINSAGNVVGNYEVFQLAQDNGIRACYWGPGSEFVTLASLNSAGTSYQDTALSINDGGVIVGSSQTRNGSTFGTTHAVRWDTTNSTPVILEGLGVDPSGIGYSAAYHVNASGNVLGFSSKFANDGTYLGGMAVRWNQGSTTPIELGSVTIDSQTAYHTPTFFTNSNVAAGNASIRVGTISKSVAVRWSPAGVATVLDNFGSGTGGAMYSFVYGLNELGVAVGASAKYDSSGNRTAHQAVRWSASSSAIEELTHPSFGTDRNGFSLSRAVAVNLRGLAVGFVNKYDTSGDSLGSVGAVWLPNGQFINANVLNPMDDDGVGTWDIQTFDSMSANGWVSGTGNYTRDGVTYRRGFVTRLGLGGSWVHPGTGTSTGTTPTRWMDGENWETGTAALGQGNARFASLASHRILVDEGVVTNSIHVQRGNVLLTILGHRLLSREGLTIDQGARMSVGTEVDPQSGNLGFFDGSISNQGSLSAGNSPGLLAVNGSLFNSGELRFEIAGSDNGEFDRIWLTGDFIAGGTLKLELLDGFSPVTGDTFELMRFDAFDDQGMTLDLSLATLQPGLVWDTSQFASSGVFSVVAVPEPASVLVLASILVLGIFRRSRN